MALNDGTMVQMWASIPDPDNSGTFESFTCTAHYTRNAEHSDFVKVNNFYGSMLFTQDEVDQN